MSSRRSHRMHRRRKPCSQEMVRSRSSGRCPAGTVRLATFGDHWADPALPQEPAVLVVIVAAVREEHVGPSPGPAHDSSHCRPLVPQRQQLGDIVVVPAGQRHRERDALAVGDDVVPAARPCVVDRAGSALRLLCAAWAWEEFDHRPGPVQLGLRLQLVRQQLVQLLPDTGLVPGRQTPPARHARPVAELLPLNAGGQHEQDPAQCLPVGHPRPSLRLLRRRLRQQRFDVLVLGGAAGKHDRGATSGVLVGVNCLPDAPVGDRRASRPGVGPAVPRPAARTARFRRR